jgi:phage terminase large subunit-like protein
VKQGTPEASLYEALPPEEKALLEELVAIEGQLLDVLDYAGIDTYIPLDHQRRFHELNSSNRWMIGANRMGKSVSIEHEIDWFAKGTHPHRAIPPAGQIWACCASNEVSLNHQMPRVQKIIGDSNIKRIVYKPIPMMTLNNGKTIVFKNYEQTPLKYAGQDPILIAFDEEPPWDIMEECYSRRSSKHELNIVGAVTPVKGLTWLFEKVVENGWPEALFVGGRAQDNVHLSKDELSKMDRGLTGVMRRIRFLGEILPIGGTMIFDPERLSRMLRAVREPIASFDRENGRWVQVDEGPLRIWGHEGRFPWQWAKDGVRFEYVIGCDPAEGLNTSHSDAEPEHDETSIHVKNRHTQEIEAEFTSGIAEPDLIGEQVLPSLSDMFNQAKVNVERNNHGHTVIAFFKRKYPGRLYIPPEDRTDRRFRLNEQYGHLETKQSRAYLIDLLRKAVRANKDFRIPSPKALRQMLTFVRKSNGRMEHQEGAKDDCVFSLGLCEVLDYESRPVQPLKIITPEKRALRAAADFSKEHGPQDLRDAKPRPPTGATNWFRRF